MADGDLKVTPVVWGLIGDATPGAWDNSTDMTYDEEKGCWTVIADMIVGGYKFRANNDWGINGGGDLTDLTADGSNITCAEAGTYKFELYLNRTDTDKLYCVVVKQ